MSADLHIVPDALQGEARRAIMAALRADNRAKVGDSGRRSLALALRVEGDLIGGLVGETFMGWLAVDGLWIAEAHRGGGHGAALMTRAEAEARSRGATNCLLDTFSFQAPDFYRKLGYREFGRLDGFPAGHCRHYMTKSL